MTGASPVDDLPGELLMWVLIVSELLVFGAGLEAGQPARTRADGLGGCGGAGGALRFHQRRGIYRQGTERHRLGQPRVFYFFYGLTGFHAAHVLAGVLLLLFVARRDAEQNIEAAAMFWHMVDLIWVLLFPIIYLLG